MIVTVLGLGYVGLPTALAFAEAGWQVLGCDIDEERLAAVKAGDVDVLAADRTRLARALAGDSFTLTANLAAIALADAVVVCVPTPVDAHLVPDLEPLGGACAAVVEHARPGQVVVLTSTTYIGCTRRLLVEPLAGRGLHAGRDLFVAFGPERIDPGHPEHAQERVPRVVGGATAECGTRAAAVLSQVTHAVHGVSSLEAAEATKLLENTFRAVNIAFANEFADMTREFGLDVTEIIDAAATKPYGYMPFYPGPGAGGHCIPCDPHYLLWQLRPRSVRLPLTETAMSALALRPRHVVARATEVLGAAGRPVAGASVLVVGVSYKAGVDDVRGSPAVEIIGRLRRLGATVDFSDPRVDSLLVDGATLLGVDPLRPGARYDLVIVHTADPGGPTPVPPGAALVLDATYRSDVAGRVVL